MFNLLRNCQTVFLPLLLKGKTRDINAMNVILAGGAQPSEPPKRIFQREFSDESKGTESLAAKVF